MSFSKEVKEELSRQLSSARHCQLAELAAILDFCGRMVRTEDGRELVCLYTDNLAVARKYFTLVKKTFNITTNISIRRNLHLKKGKAYSLCIQDENISKKIIQGAKLTYSEEQERFQSDHLIIQSACCKRAFLRGAFLASGSISDPEKTYH